MCSPRSATPSMRNARSATSTTVSMSRPNFTPLTLVSVLACVFGGKSGLTRSAHGATLPIDDATRPSSTSSSSLSTSKSMTPWSSAMRISASVLPTPANTTFAAGPPACTAR